MNNRLKSPHWKWSVLPAYYDRLRRNIRVFAPESIPTCIGLRAKRYAPFIWGVSANLRAYGVCGLANLLVDFVGSAAASGQCVA